MNNNNDRRIEDHEILGQTRIFRAEQPPYDPTVDTDPGVLVVGNGMSVKVLAAFYNWNGVDGLDMLYVHVPATGLQTHVTPADLGWTTPLNPPTQTVTVLSYDHRHGHDTFVFSKPELATQRLARIVEQYWAEDGPGRDGEPLPDSDDDKIPAYFEYVSDEYYSIDTVGVITE